MSMRTILLLAALASAAWAQTVSTQILGLVTDRTGAVLPGATVRARRVATGDVRTTQTMEVGDQVERVEVTAAAGLLHTEDATLGSVDLPHPPGPYRRDNLVRP